MYLYELEKFLKAIKQCQEVRSRCLWWMSQENDELGNIK